MTWRLRRLGDWCAAHPLRVIAAWLVVAAAVTSLSIAYGGTYTQHERLPGTEVERGLDVLSAHFPAAAGETADVVLHDRLGRRLDPDALAAVQAAIVRLPHVVAGSVGEPVRSRDGTTVRLSIAYDVDRFHLASNTLTRLQHAARTASGRGVDGYVAGILLADFQQPSSGLGEKVGIGVAVLVLLVAFGSVIAALMPIATAALGIVTGLGLVKLLAGVYAVNDSAPQLATMIGLGVGIDYALFIVTRHREGLRSGLDAPVAAATSTATAGASVFWAGITVVAAICGLAFAGIPVITSLGFASAIVVATSVASALTILPALLSLTDEHIDHLHIPLPHLRHERVGARLDPSLPARPAGWTRWARAIGRHPVPYAIGATVLLGVLAIPVAGMRLGMPDGGSAAPGTDAHRVYVLMADEFGVGANGPLQLVVSDNPVAAESTVRAVAVADPDVASVGPMRVSPDGSVGVMTVVPRSGPQSLASAQLVPRLRTHLRAAHAHGYVTGLPAGRYDVGQRVLDRLGWFVGAVLSVSFVLLMLVFRSVLVPLKAVLLNLLSIAAALGVVVAVFSWGWLSGIVGVHEPVPLVDVIPMILFAIVFGLSMDYEVFLLSRVREEWYVDRDAKDSVVRGLTSTARVITAAAAIMVSVFFSFTLSGDVVVKMMGVGLAVAVFLDATVIRLVLVPATMSLLGDLNWWVPRWLGRLLPRVDVGDVAVSPSSDESYADLSTAGVALARSGAERSHRAL